MVRGMFAGTFAGMGERLTMIFRQQLGFYLAINHRLDGLLRHRASGLRRINIDPR